MIDLRRARDISVATSATTPEWPGDTPFTCGWSWRIAAGESANVSAVTCSPHVGTHADAPLHVRDGAGASELLPVDAFVGPAFVLGVGVEPRDIGAEIESLVPTGTQRLLLRSDAGIAAGTFPADWPALTPAAALALVARGLRLLGVDAPSVDRRESRTLPVHHALFDGGGCVLENLDLRGITDGAHELVALPLRWVGLDAAPVRALLIDGSR